MSKRVVIFANGDLSHPQRIRAELRPGDRIVCADGGAQHALALGLSPHTLVGDLDSISEAALRALEASRCEIVKYPSDKDQTDLELAIEHALLSQPAELMLVSALGGRFDHLLGNCLALARESLAKIDLQIFDGMTRARLLRGPCATKLDLSSGDTLSLLAIDSNVKNLNLSGAKWPLANAELKFGSCLGISNVVTGQGISIELGSGMLYAITTAAS